MKCDYFFKSNGKFSATKTMMTVGGALVITRWLIGGIEFGGFSAAYVTGTEVGVILFALGFNRGFSSQNKKVPE